MELVNIKGNTYILNAHNKVGIYVYNNEAVIIDTGLTEEVGNEIMQICQDNNWQIKMILNTHAHPDHIGGNKIIQDTLNIPVYAKGLERLIIESPILISAMANGGAPHKYLYNPYLFPAASKVIELTPDILPEGIEYFDLPGHNSEMVGFKTKDNVYFLADAVAGANIITKHKLQFMFDVKNYFKTLDFLQELKGDFFIPSHGEVSENIKELVTLNRNTINEVIDKLKEICKDGANFDKILKEITTFFHIKLEFVQYSFTGCTVRCYLAYMLNEGMIEAKFIDNELIWITH